MPMTRNDTRSSVQIRKLTYSALYLAIALVLPFLTGQIPEIGSMLCPMHIPALLCGFVCGWPWGLAVGFVSPLLRSLLFGMPTAYTAAAMAFELAAYGAVSGILYRIFPRRNWSVYVTLIAAMIVGRLVNMCIKSGDTLDTLTLKDFRAISGLFDEDVYKALELETCVNGRSVYGGPARESVEKQISNIEGFLAQRS